VTAKQHPSLADMNLEILNGTDLSKDTPPVTPISEAATMKWLIERQYESVSAKWLSSHMSEAGIGVDPYDLIRCLALRGLLIPEQVNGRPNEGNNAFHAIWTVPTPVRRGTNVKAEAYLQALQALLPPR
jgi:hypothetical protein